MLTEEHQTIGVACALDFSDRYHPAGDQLKENNFKGDDTWVSHITPE